MKDTLFTRPEDSAFAYVAEWGCSVGLNVREYFAARAMQGILASPNGAFTPNGHGGHNHPEHIAVYALACADALIEKLNEPNNAQ